MWSNSITDVLAHNKEMLWQEMNKFVLWTMLSSSCVSVPGSPSFREGPLHKLTWVWLSLHLHTQIFKDSRAIDTFTCIWFYVFLPFDCWPFEGRKSICHFLYTFLYVVPGKEHCPLQVFSKYQWFSF